MTGAANSPRGQSPGSSLGFIIIHVPPRTAPGAPAVCLLGYHSLSYLQCPHLPRHVSTAWEAGVEGGSSRGLGLMVPQTRLCIDKGSGLTLEEGVNYHLLFLCGWAAQLVEQETAES